jgi:hypothetical protein
VPLFHNEAPAQIPPATPPDLLSSPPLTLSLTLLQPPTYDDFTMKSPLKFLMEVTDTGPAKRVWFKDSHLGNPMDEQPMDSYWQPCVRGTIHRPVSAIYMSAVSLLYGVCVLVTKPSTSRESLLCGDHMYVMLKQFEYIRI